MNKLIYIIFFGFQLLTSGAQEKVNTHSLAPDTLIKVMQVDPITEEPQMADVFRSEGKIYVVIAVLAIVFLSLIVYLIYIDHKLKKLETKVKQTHNSI